MYFPISAYQSPNEMSILKRAIDTLHTVLISCAFCPSSFGETFFFPMDVTLYIHSTCITCMTTLPDYNNNNIYDSVLGKRVLTYMEILDKQGKCWLQSHECLRNTHGKLYISGKVSSSAFQKCILFHSYNEDIHLAVIKVSPIFPVRQYPFP